MKANRMAALKNYTEKANTTGKRSESTEKRALTMVGSLERLKFCYPKKYLCIGRASSD